MRCRLLSSRSTGVLLSLLVASLAAGGCASVGETGGSNGGDRNTITREALFELEGMDAREAIQRLRPQWLRERRTGTGPPRLPGLIVDGQEMEIFNLRGMRIEGIQEIRYMEARDASIRYGTGYPVGVIIVIQRQ